jgi:hypothetical protein
MSERKQRASHLKWIRLGDLVPSPYGQRRFEPAWANEIASDLKLEEIGFPVVSLRDGIHYVVDGQHRVAALRIFGFTEEDTIQCEVYEGLTPKEEAERFLQRNHNKAVSAVSKFEVAVKAERQVESAIDQVVRMNGLQVGRFKGAGKVSAVGTLRKVVDRYGGLAVLGRVLRIIRDAYGDAGFDASIIEGLAVCLHRYNGQIDEAAMIDRLAKTAGGLNGLTQPAMKTYVAMGQPKAQCIAASAVSIYNRDQKSKKLAPWWKE